MPEEQPTDALEELRRLVRPASAGRVERVAWETPPSDLWARIASETFPPADDLALDDEPPTPMPVVSLDSRRRRRLWIVGAAAAVIIVIVGVATLTRRPDDATVVAATDLEALGESGSGHAEIVDNDGSLELRLVTDDVDPPDGFTEVWLINTDVTELISLGPIRSDGTYDLPAGLDPSAFPIVDVSFEPFDGNPQHSGESVLRGQLVF